MQTRTLGERCSTATTRAMTTTRATFNRIKTLAIATMTTRASRAPPVPLGVDEEREIDLERDREVGRFASWVDQDRMAGSVRRARIKGLHFHDLCREAASTLLEGHVSESAVQKILGHADISTTSTYLATTRKGLHVAMRRFEALRDAREQRAASTRNDASSGTDSRIAQSDRFT